MSTFFAYLRKTWFVPILWFPAMALAATYTLSGTVGGADYPACSGGAWSSSGSTRTCSGTISLASGDNILPSNDRTIVANSITLAGNNTIGSSGDTVSLQTTWGQIQSNGSGTVVYGNLTSASGAINVTNTSVNGAITTSGTVSLNGSSVTGNVSGNNGVTTTNGTVIGGNVTASSGAISLSGGSVAGSVSSGCCTVTTTNTNVGNGISSSNNSVNINGGTIAGTISSSGGSGISISNATVTSGSINAGSVPIVISNSTIGSSSTVNVTGANTVTLSNNTTVSGNVTAGAWSGALNIDGTSLVTGNCSPSHSRCGMELQITAATVNGATSATVAPSASVTVSYTVIARGGDTEVEGTRWLFGTSPPPTTCANSSPDSPNNTNGTYTTGFTATAPATAGTYNLYLIANSADDCGGGESSPVFTLPNALVVTVPPPYVVSINRASFDPAASGAQVSWTVVFSASMTGVSASDFTLLTTGSITGASILSVTGTGTTRTVTASTASGTNSFGTLALRLVDDDSVVNAGGVPLGGVGVGNGSFTGQAYTIIPATCTGTELFCDDFERTVVSGGANSSTSVGTAPGYGAWTTSTSSACSGTSGNRGCAGIDSDVPPWSTYSSPRANSSRSLYTRWSTVTVASPVVNLSAQSGAKLSFWMRRGSDCFSEWPGNITIGCNGTIADYTPTYGEEFQIQYKNSSGSWVTLVQYPEIAVPGEIVAPTIDLPDDALHANFQLRFYQPGGTGCGLFGGCQTGGGADGVVGYDYWHLDNVKIVATPATPYSGAFCDTFEGDLSRWTVTGVGSVQIGSKYFQNGTHDMDVRWNTVVATTKKHDMTNATGDITYWVKRGIGTNNLSPNTSGSNYPESGKNLVVEYLNSSNVWTNLATYSGGGTAGQVFLASYPIPAGAKHANFRLRFRLTSGTGFDLDYWHVDDVCVGSLLQTSDLALTKTGTGAFSPGQFVTYTMTVTNNGPDTELGPVTIIDTLPAELSFVTTNSPGWTCDPPVGQVVTCNRAGSLAVGASATLALEVQVGVDASGSLTNVARVGGQSLDLTPANNIASFTKNLFAPKYVFTSGPCPPDTAIGTGSPACQLVNWGAATAGIPTSNMYLTSINLAGVPTPLSADSVATVGFQFALSCHNPAANAGVQATFSGSATALPLCAANGAVPTSWSTATNQPFDVGAASSGPFSFNYNDVGQVELYMRNAVVTSDTGTSGAFVVKPYGFKYSLACANNFSTAATASPTYTYCPSGENFTGTITAVAYDSAQTNNLGAATPNYGKETTVQTVGFVADLIAPTAAAGGTLGTVTTTLVAPPAPAPLWSNGQVNATLTWSEVGTMGLVPVINYLGAGDISADGKSDSQDLFGPKRFYPYRMGLADNGSADGAPASDLTYVGQPFKLGFTLTALNKSGSAVKNYGLTGYTQRATGAAVSVAAENSDDGVSLGANVETDPGAAVPSFALAWPDTANTDAVATVAAANYHYLRGNPIAPLDALKIGIRFVDNSGDSVPLSNGDMNQATAGACAPSCDALALVTTRMRYGRLMMSNAFGSELLALPVMAQIQYWNGMGWQQNALDSNAVLAAPTLSNYRRHLAAGETVASVWSPVRSGNLGLRLSAPGAANDGSVDLTLVAPTWLQFDWDGDGTHDNSPTARATFGVKKNNFIFLRENY